MMYRRLFLIVFLWLQFPVITSACDVLVTVDGTQKETYKGGEIIIVKVTVVLKHRNCNVAIEETAINVSGAQITGTTKWVNTSGRTWERKIRVRVTEEKTKHATITAERTCDRDGGKGSLTLAITS